MSAPALSRVAVWPATQTILPPSVITPGEKARESWEQALELAREAGLEDAIRPLVEVRLADLDRLS